MEIKIIPHSPLPFVLSRYRDTVDRGRFQEGLTRSIFQDRRGRRKSWITQGESRVGETSSFFFFPLFLAIFSLLRRSIIAVGRKEKRKRGEKDEETKARLDKRERERKGKNRFCQVLVACLITALHERYALAAHEIT